MRGLVRAIATAALTAALTASPAAGRDWPRIRIGSEGGHPPFNSLDAAGRLQGFEIELARAVCERLKAQCDFVTEDFERLIPALLAGRYDAVFSSLSITEPRKALIAFSTSYYRTPSVFVVARRNGGMSVEPRAMSGKSVGAKAGATNARFLQEVYAPAGVVVKTYQTHDEARLDLAEGRLDALLGDKAPLLHWLETSATGRCCQIAGPDLVEPAYFGEGVGVGLRKTDADLKALIDGALAALREDGAYDAIRAKYFPYDLR